MERKSNDITNGEQRSVGRKQKLKSLLVTLLMLLGFTLLLEITLFNYRYWESKNYKSIENLEVHLGTGIESEGKGRFRITNSAEAYITLSDFKEHINNLYLNIQPLEGVCTYIELYADDAGNQLGLRLGDTTIVSSVPQSWYTRLHLSGDSTYVKIKINHPDGYEFYIDTMPGLNTVRPFMLSWLRMIVIFGISSFLYLFRPKSELYFMSMILDTYWKKAIVTVFVIIQLIIIFVFSRLIMPEKFLKELNNHYPVIEQYNELADAFMKGQVYLDREPPKSLNSVENPYDPGLRHQIVVVESSENFSMDYAYFNGKYYCYFGPVPVLLFYIPARLLLHKPCSTWNIATLCAFLFCISGFGIIYVIGKRYYKHLSLGVYLLMSLLYVWGSAIIYLIFYGVIYSVPILCGLLFGTGGLACWISARHNGKLKRSRLIGGAVLIALILGCRPQMAIVLFLAFPIFWSEIISKEFFSKKGMANTMCIIIPFLLIGLALMYYNYQRFQSPFDFGANYNLTSNDMTNRGFIIDRIPLGAFVYLFQPSIISVKYPYHQVINIANDYMGLTNSEPLFGGFFSINIICIISLFVFRMKKNLERHGVNGIAIGCFLFAIIVMLADIQMAGLTQRYMSDFGWLIILCTILQIFALDSIVEAKWEMLFREGILALMSVTLFLNFWTVLINGRYADLINTNPTVFYKVKYLLPFI